MRDRTCTEHLARTPHESTEVSSQRVATGRAGEGGVTKGPGEVTLGDGITAYVMRHSPPLDEALTEVRTFRPATGRADRRKRITRVEHAAAWRKWS